MKLATLKTKSRDGELIVVSKDNSKWTKASHIAPTLQSALDDWSTKGPELAKLYDSLNGGKCDSFSLDASTLHSPLPRAYQWADGSAFIEHIKLVRKARNAPLPETLETVPLMYQGGSDTFLAPTQDIPMVDEKHGVDFEGEVAVVTDFVPMGTKEKEALKHIKLIMLCNDVSLRGLIPGELAQGFGFFQSKPSSSFAPFAVTPDELGDSWKEGRVHLPLVSHLNGKPFGSPNGDEMFFHFGQLIAHAAYTRDLGPGAIIGSGTFSNEDYS
ncbi:MAG: fumarylacetoacetate hydrolase family protein, partial [Bdellovibrionales bacterium]|nr:fumarylacetoacetate hydrolase family protein [Bdellovibrionales bacterium]